MKTTFVDDLLAMLGVVMTFSVTIITVVVTKRTNKTYTVRVKKVAPPKKLFAIFSLVVNTCN